MTTPHTYRHYYEVLGLTPGATLQQVKRAYRALAKRFHPDVSREPDAQERFIEINEAYEFLLRYYGGSAGGPPRGGAYRRPSAPSAEELFRQWLERERRRARARAARAARQRYREFTRSPLYRTSQIVSAAYDYIILGVGLLMIAGAVAGVIHNIHDLRNNSTIPVDRRSDIITTQIVSTVLLSLTGILFIVFAGFSIRDRREERRRRKKERHEAV